jgi:hypothetical protein
MSRRFRVSQKKSQKRPTIVSKEIPTSKDTHDMSRRFRVSQKRRNT